mgnify:CR=1 FL=1
MSNLEEIRAERIDKIEKIKAANMDPYAISTARTISIKDFVENFLELEKSGKEHVLAGRIMARRGHGALAFLDLNDGTSRIQVLIKQDLIGEKELEVFDNTVDVGDFVEVTGAALTTERGAQSLEAKSWNMLTKSILPLPKEHFGIKDEDDKFRKRYLDILLDEEVADMVQKKSKFWNVMRSFLLDQGYTEVETPVLENTTGGAEAEPFTTHHNALDIDVYLRISPELWLKKLMVAGVPKVFEIGRIFRNEGMSNEHLQDYTQIEFYEAYSDYTKGMEMVKELYRKVAHDVFGTGKFIIKGHEVDLDAEWEVYNFSEIIEERFGINPITEIYTKTGKKVELKELEDICEKAGIEYEHVAHNITRTIDNLWKSIRKEFSGPGFLIGIPKQMEPLAKSSEVDDRIVERFQVILAGSEMGKGFSELNDPQDQRARFEEQQQMRDAGDEEAQMADMTYVEALEHGMPPTFGFGVSERLFSFLMDKNIRETQIFPLMRPKE